MPHISSSFGNQEAQLLPTYLKTFYRALSTPCGLGWTTPQLGYDPTRPPNMTSD